MIRWQEVSVDVDEEREYDRIMNMGGKESNKDNVKIVEAFRRVFTTTEGKLVLNQLLIDLKYYDECVTETDTALNNYAKFMIKERLQVNNRSKVTAAILEARNEQIK